MKTHLASGKRDKLVTIQQRSATDAKGGSGAPVETWTTLRQAWLGRVDRRGDERFKQSAQISASSEADWYLPFTADMNPETVNVPKLRRLLYQGRVFDITAAEVIGAHRGILLSTLVEL